MALIKAAPEPMRIPNTEHAPDNPRRDFLRKTLTLIPVVTVASTGLGVGASQLLAARNSSNSHRKCRPRPPAGNYQPTFFSAEEWAFLQKPPCPASFRPMSLAPRRLEAGAPHRIINRPRAFGYRAGCLHQHRITSQLSQNARQCRIWLVVIATHRMLDDGLTRLNTPLNLTRELGVLYRKRTLSNAAKAMLNVLEKRVTT